MDHDSILAIVGVVAALAAAVATIRILFVVQTYANDVRVAARKSEETGEQSRRSLERQVEMMELGRRDTVRPLLVLRGLLYTSNDRPVVVMENVGLGPATDVSVTLWTLPLTDVLDSRAQERIRSDVLSDALSKIGSEPRHPHFAGRTAGVGAGRREYVVMAPQVIAPILWHGAGGAVILCSIRFADISNAHYPPEPTALWVRPEDLELTDLKGTFA